MAKSLKAKKKRPVKAVHAPVVRPHPTVHAGRERTWQAACQCGYRSEEIADKARAQQLADEHKAAA